MDDLISKKKLLSDINTEEDKILSGECESPLTLPALQWFRAAIAGQPTAYDLDKVLAQLEEVKTDCEKYRMFEVLPIVGKCIAIVKAGGRDE